MKFSVCLLVLLLQFFVPTNAQTLRVKNESELRAALKNTRPGTTIIMENGEWKNLNLELDGEGTKEKPIIVKAGKPGAVTLTGRSSLKLGGTYITVDGLCFMNGYAGNNSVIDFRINKNKLANHCRVTNTVINSFNNPKRLDENYWVSFYGKNNQLDHCSFLDKKNLGVLLAVILDDNRSRENFHSIDHNYFGPRLPLASNGGEIIRVGVSQHCEFNSNTQIRDNFFEHCDGETEIISLKSGSNTIRNNLFKECQGAVVLRHGNFNTVENNIFLGNNKEGTGGVRIINKGQWVVNNLFYQCRGTGFRSPLSVMNGVPNSPAFRYVTAEDAVIANNSFIASAPVSFCEGADTERLEPPKNIQVINNLFYNNAGSPVFLSYDDMNGFHFSGNHAKELTATQARVGFKETPISLRNFHGLSIPTAAKTESSPLPDSLQVQAAKRLQGKLSSLAGFSNGERWLKIEDNAYRQCGAGWFSASTLSSRRLGGISSSSRPSREPSAAISSSPLSSRPSPSSREPVGGVSSSPMSSRPSRPSREPSAAISSSPVSSRRSGGISSSRVSSRPSRLFRERLGGISSSARPSRPSREPSAGISSINCPDAASLEQALAANQGKTLKLFLTGKEYQFSSSLNINCDLLLTAPAATTIKFSGGNGLPHLFQLEANNRLVMQQLSLDLQELQVSTFLVTDTSGSSGHSSISMLNNRFVNLNAAFFKASKSSLSDSIIIMQNQFVKCKGNLFDFGAETDKKGYYNVEKLMITGNSFNNLDGQLLIMLRGGNDESTLGPALFFTNNELTAANSPQSKPLVHLYGTQSSLIKNNRFHDSSPTGTLILFEDAVRARHLLINNEFKNAGHVIKNKFVETSEP